MKKYPVRSAIPDSARDALAEHSALLQKLLYYRGISTPSEAESFLNPDYNLHTHDPFLMKDMERAVERVLRAMEQNERVVIYSDYDCDGIPGGVLLHDLFKKVGYENFENYIPHRHEEGYGLNISAIESVAERGARVLITVDCGITDTMPVARANELGVDVIITDHHLVPDELPKAYAILNPKQKDDNYPYDMLCGTGVAFKFAQALLQRLRNISKSNDPAATVPCEGALLAPPVLALRRGREEDAKTGGLAARPRSTPSHGTVAAGSLSIHPEWEKWLLDMVGLATIADMVPLTGENRVLARYGLTVLRKSPRPGLLALCRTMRTAKHTLTEDDIGFMVAPRINAASRMGRPHDAFRLLSTSDVAEANEYAKHLHTINNQRKGLVASIAKEAKHRLSERETLAPVVVLGDPRWRPALLGLVANTLVEEYERPIFLWGREGGETIKGSCRSAGDVSVVSLMGQTAEHFIDYGGHAFSGGFSTEAENIHRLESALVEAHAALPKDTPSERYVDMELSLSDVTWKTYAQIEKFAPFGESNPKPVFLFRGVEITRVEHFGKEKNHLRLVFDAVSAIGFFTSAGAYDRPLATGERVDLVASLEKSFFRGTPELRLRIVDIV